MCIFFVNFGCELLVIDHELSVDLSMLSGEGLELFLLGKLSIVFQLKNVSFTQLRSSIFGSLSINLVLSTFSSGKIIGSISKSIFFDIPHILVSFSEGILVH